MIGVELNSTKKLRACYKCKLIKDQETWKKDKTCQNCQGQFDIFEDTTLNFEGMIALTKPGQSWVSKSQNLIGKVPGIYCIKIHGELPSEIQSEYENEHGDDDDDDYK